MNKQDVLGYDDFGIVPLGGTNPNYFWHKT